IEGLVLQNLSKGAAQAGGAIDVTRQLETLLETLGATGKGLHERTSSVEAKLPAALVRKLRFVASVRNKIVHEDELLPDDDFAEFVETGKLAIAELATAGAGTKTGKARGKGKPRKKSSPRPGKAATDTSPFWSASAIRQLGFAFLGGIALVFLLMVLGNDGPKLWAGAFLVYFALGGLVLRKIRRAAAVTSVD
ncbi:MAG TPA: hypothetical protein VFF03_18715, partial [Rhodocyclaceae bacterium]|nr:hypothetical protein [Rhodocyclaceae bacterium]